LEKDQRRENKIIQFLKLREGEAYRGQIDNFMLEEVEEELRCSKHVTGMRLISLEGNNKLEKIPIGGRRVIYRCIIPPEKPENIESAESQIISTITKPDLVPTNTKHDSTYEAKHKTYLIFHIDETIRLLESVLYILDMVQIKDYPMEKLNEIKNDCKIAITQLIDKKKNYQSFSNIVSNIQYQEHLRHIREKLSTKGNQYTVRDLNGMTDFRRDFYKEILGIRNRCIDICNELANDLSEDVRMISEYCTNAVSWINKICRIGFNPWIDQFQYDGDSDRFKIPIRDYMTTRDHITGVYCDGFLRTPDIIHTGSDPDYIIEMKPCSHVGSNSIHIITIRTDCVEFTFKLIGDRWSKTNSASLYPEEKYVSLRFDHDFSKDPKIIITKDMGGDVTKKVESLEDMEFSCTCGKNHQCQGWYGKRHDHGIADKKGESYLIFLPCNIISGYNTKLEQVKNHLIKV